MSNEPRESSVAASQIHREMESLAGRKFHLQDEQQVREVIEHAFDYRGDVTLDLRSGESVEGYVFNRSVEGSCSQLEMFLRGEPGTRVIPYSEILAVHFSGEDTACGKSWEAWVQKKQSSSHSFPHSD